jgi:sulfide:quinone oxidoreductase
MGNHTKMDHIIEHTTSTLNQAGISRRDALKMGGMGAVAMMLAHSEASATMSPQASNAKGKIVIVGGGFAGLAILNKLYSTLSHPNLTLIEPSETVYYQPAYTLIATGINQASDVIYKTSEYLPSGAVWIRHKAMEFYPDENYLITSEGTKVPYDYLVITTGVTSYFNQIEGLSYDQVGKNGIGSVYDFTTCQGTFTEMKKFCEKGGEGLFSHPNTPIKCGGAPKKIQFLTDGYARKIGTRDKINTTFLPNGGSMFSVKEYHDAIVGFYKERDMKWKYKHNLVAIDPEKKEATFEHTYQVKGAFDEILGEHEMITKKDRIDLPYDFIHVTPPMGATPEIKHSPFSWKKGSAAKGGFIETNKETLQHARYKNVFCCGDVAGIPMGKTGGSVRKQYSVLVNNLIATMKGEAMSAKYTGYTVCPLITGYGKVALLEFDWSKKPKPSFPIDPTVDRWIYWILKVYMLRPMTMHGMLRGHA